MKPSLTKKSKEPVKILSQAEQEAIIKEEILKFSNIAKEKKVLSIEEINELLPPEILLPAILDSFMQALEAMGVSISDHTDEAEKAEEGDSPFLSDIDEEEEEDEGERNDQASEKKKREKMSKYFQAWQDTFFSGRGTEK